MTCTESIQALLSGPGYDTLPEIMSGVPVNFSVTATSNSLFALRVPIFQTITFSVALTTFPYSTAFSVFLIMENGTIVPYGGASVNALTGAFVVDVPQGNFVVCVRAPSTPQTGSFIGTFVSYPSTAHISPRAGAGEAVTLQFAATPIPPRECNEALFFEIVEGNPPPGIIMDWQGTLMGTLPNMDCLDEPLSPGVGWYYTENDGNIHPWGKTFRFKVRVHIDGIPEVSAEEWFCVKVHNNWSFDRDNFLSQVPFEKTIITEVIEQPKPLAPMCYPCAEEVQDRFVPKAIEPPCKPCAQQGQTAKVELIELPESLCDIKADDVLVWYEQNRHTDFDSCCPELRRFRELLETSDAFQALRARAGYREDTTAEFVAVSRHHQFLQLAQMEIDARLPEQSVAELMDMWRNHENQVLPITTQNWDGQRMEISLDKR